MSPRRVRCSLGAARRARPVEGGVLLCPSTRGVKWNTGYVAFGAVNIPVLLASPSCTNIVEPFTIIQRGQDEFESSPQQSPYHKGHRENTEYCNMMGHSQGTGAP